MSLEIEMKAHVSDKKLNNLKDNLKKNSQYIGTVDKTDIYWSTDENGPLLFRTRLQTLGNKTFILFTKKPKQQRLETEINSEIEYTTSAKYWDTIQDFYKALNFKICLNKYKKGWEFQEILDEKKIHIELMKVNNLGYFFEAEITTDKEKDNFIIESQKALFHLFEKYNLTDSIERDSYRSMIVNSKQQ